MLKKALVSLACCAVAAGTVFAAPTAHAEPVKTRVLILPGQALGVGFAPAFSGLSDYLTANGYPNEVLDLRGEDLKGDTATIERAVKKLHREHPNDKIALVGHSISGITSRAYLKEHGGSDLVDTYIAMGTAQYGSPASCGNSTTPENCPGTDYINRLNAGDDTPGDTKYYSLRNEREYATGDLDGGQCRQTPMPEVAGVPVDFQHTVEPFDQNAWKLIKKSLDGECVGTFVDDPDGKLTGRNSMLPDAPYYKEHKR